MRPFKCSQMACLLKANSKRPLSLLPAMRDSTPLTWIRRHLVTTILAVAYIAMSMLIFEQGRVIDNQRVLIRQLFSDSLELSARKMQEQRSHNLRKQ